MAFQLKHWLGVVALGLAVVAAWRLPLDSSAERRFIQQSEAEREYGRLSAELRMARTRLDQMRRAESLPSTALEQSAAGLALLLPEDASVRPQTASGLRERIASEATALGPMVPGMLVGYGYDGSNGGETGLAVSETFRLETYVGGTDDNAYCLQVIVARPQMIDFLADEDLAGRGWSRWTRSLLGPCVFYAAYGLAGPGIQSWLEAGGRDFAFGHPFGDTPDFPHEDRPRLFGTGTLELRGPSAVGRCMAGDARACEQSFVDPRGLTARGTEAWREVDGLPATFTGSARGGLFPADDWLILSDLEREFGSDAFRTFWKSEGDVATAFRSAFGVEAGEWLLGWVERRQGLTPRSPAPTLPTTFAGLLTVALMTGLASTWHTRRQVV